MQTKLQVILSLSRTLNYTKTARELYLTQPAVTQNIQAAEKQYGFQIFRKVGRDISITNEGKILVKYFARIESLEKQMGLALSDYKLNRHHIDIGLSPTASEYLIPLVFEFIRTKMKNVSINFHVHVLSELMVRMKALEFDFLIIDEPLTNHEYNAEMILEDNVVVVASAKSMYRTDKPLDLKNIVNFPMILRHTKSSTRALLENYLAAKNIQFGELSIIAEIENIHIIKSMVEKDFGITVLPSSVVKEELRAGKLALVPTIDFDLKRETYLVYPKQTANIQLIEFLIAKLRQEFDHHKNQQ